LRHQELTPEPQNLPPHTHTHVPSYTLKLSSWKINVFNNVIILLAMFSIIYLLFRLKSSMSQVLPIYFNFIVLATVTFVFVVIINLVGDASADDITAKRILKVRCLWRQHQHIV